MNAIIATLKKFNLYIFRQIYLLILKFESFFKSIEAFFKKDKILIDKPYQNEKILLIALFKKGQLRPDIKRLLSIAKDQGYYIVGVNTGKLSKETSLSDLFDLYIERFNFGRDFGSYKSGFQTIFKRKYHLSCPRLLMLNDSVFYESNRTPGFLQELMTSDIEVLGATENHQYVHHLGSFCIAYSGNILCHQKFMDFWNSYKNSDVRPIVIDKGEKKLTECLKRIVDDQTSVQALYDVNRISETLALNTHILNIAFQQTCRSGLHLRLSAKDTWRIFLDQYYYVGADFEYDPQALHDVDSFIHFAKNTLQIDDLMLEDKAKQFVRSQISHSFVDNSQIHTNAVFLMQLGFPLIKLDGIYRGTLSHENIHELCELMNVTEGKELKRLLLLKPYGSQTLENIDRAVFECGFI
jgi:hypothetical protein